MLLHLVVECTDLNLQQAFKFDLIFTVFLFCFVGQACGGQSETQVPCGGGVGPGPHQE